ncbi:aminotransferase class III-fold pyridoxal phosphate-dependent enzyme [Candidatus Kaiserbacteria bacterium]|nr:aminotransferase class III-fold pyridoxal phosphate-dependent enzyme [Candidatus Kaiserbacteria bacterium]
MKRRWTSAESRRVTDKHSAQNYNRYPAVAVASKGAYFWDPEGNKILDLLSGYSAVLTHSWKFVIFALVRFLLNPRCCLDLVSNVIYSVPYAMFCEAITRFTEFDRVLAKSDGGSATESAATALFLHAERRGIKKPKVVLIENYFHGRGRSFTTNARFDVDQYKGKGPRSRGFIVVPRTIKAIRSVLARDDVIGIILEMHRGEGGPLFDHGEYREIIQIARTLGKYVVLDGIQDCFYRCGDRLSFQEYDTEEHIYRPDAVVLGKALGGGLLPISALVGTDEFMSVFAPGTDGATFSGSPLQCVVATAVIEYLEKHGDAIGKRSKEIGRRFAENLKDIPHVDVEYRGSLIGLRIRGITSAESLCRRLLAGEYGQRIFMKHGHVYDDPHYGRIAHVRISPPILAITDEMIDEACRAIRVALLEISAKIDAAQSWPIAA